MMFINNSCLIKPLLHPSAGPISHHQDTHTWRCKTSKRQHLLGAKRDAQDIGLMYFSVYQLFSLQCLSLCFLCCYGFNGLPSLAFCFEASFWFSNLCIFNISPTHSIVPLKSVAMVSICAKRCTVCCYKPKMVSLPIYHVVQLVALKNVQLKEALPVRLTHYIMKENTAWCHESKRFIHVWNYTTTTRKTFQSRV